MFYSSTSLLAMGVFVLFYDWKTSEARENRDTVSSPLFSGQLWSLPEGCHSFCTFRIDGPEDRISSYALTSTPGSSPQS